MYIYTQHTRDTHVKFSAQVAQTSDICLYPYPGYPGYPGGCTTKMKTKKWWCAVGYRWYLGSCLHSRITSMLPPQYGGTCYIVYNTTPMLLFLLVPEPRVPRWYRVLYLPKMKTKKGKVCMGIRVYFFIWILSFKTT